MIKKIIPLAFLLLFLGLGACQKKNRQSHQTPSFYTFDNSQKTIDKKEKQFWYYKDLIKDSIPGISLFKSFAFLKKKTPTDTIIIAVLDTPLDIYHQKLREHLWINRNEIPSNHIDDDQNGFVDDIHGWNFMGIDSTQQRLFIPYESTRIIRAYKKQFGSAIDLDTSTTKKKQQYQTYIKALKKYQTQTQNAQKDLAYIIGVKTAFFNAKDKLSKLSGKKELDLQTLDSLKIIFPKDSIIQTDILRMTNFIKYKFDEPYFKRYEAIAQGRLKKMLDTSYSNILSILTIKNSKYGTPFLANDLDLSEHGTIVSGTIANFLNTIQDSLGIRMPIKIMPVCVAGFGDENDIDITAGIKYAIDNGAKVINMSFGKEFSLQKEIVDQAFRYAEQKNVLIISSAGNNGKNIDLEENFYYPNDYNVPTEFVSNFMSIGASSFGIDNKIISSFSNYGNDQVDLYAPGYLIKTLVPNNGYKYDSGTSISTAVVSQVAALIWSYYPNYKPSELKKLLIETGTTFEGDSIVQKGRILNVYNALKTSEFIVD